MRPFLHGPISSSCGSYHQIRYRHAAVLQSADLQIQAKRSRSALSTDLLRLPQVMSSPPATVFDAVRAYLLEAPAYHIALEAILVSWIVYLLFFSKQYRPATKHDKLSKEEEDELIEEWQPDPLVPDEFPNDREVDLSLVVTGTAGPHIVVNGKDCINLATFNFLGLLGNPTIKEVAANSIGKYGVGSCGPRGFYGTVDVHLELENRLAKFSGKEEAILYSYGFAAISSAIPAYSKRRDVIFCDEGVCFPIQKGLAASRSKLKFFRHNDMDHLQQLLEEQKFLDNKNPAKAKVTRKFLVTEGIFYNSGDIAPLPRLVHFRNKYKVPIFLEESLSFGVLGRTGRGACEHFNISPDDVDIVCVSLDTALASVGGFCAGKRYVIDHQRLSGLGYCFSASVPPMMAAAAIEALNIMESEPEKLSQLQVNTAVLRQLLQKCKGVVVCGDELSPVIHLRLMAPSSTQADDDALLNTIANSCTEQGVAIVAAKFLSDEMSTPPSSLRLTVCSELTEEEIRRAAKIIDETLNKHLNM